MRLRSFELRWAAAIARSIVPLGAMGGAADDLDAFALFKADCAAAPWHSVIALRLAILMTWFAPLWMRGKLRTFGSLEEPKREELLAALLTSRHHLVRMAVNYLKLLATALLLGDRRLLASMGAYDLRPLGPSR